jgi:hypothetical protein
MSIANTEAMTAAEFIEYWTGVEGGDGPYDMMSALDMYEEGLGETEAQYRSECAMFGDAGPGQGLDLRNGKAYLANVKRQLRRLGCNV